jgi:hypothetical protein
MMKGFQIRRITFQKFTQHLRACAGLIHNGHFTALLKVSILAIDAMRQNAALWKAGAVFLF